MTTSEIITINNSKESPLCERPIDDLLTMNFFIPSYQRGYRWTKQQVNDLLNDIDGFNLDSEKKSWYCLQPLVVKDISKDNKTEYEVIDGQQRLTTIFLIIHYFNEMWVGKKKISEPDIQYETRKESVDSLKNLEIDDKTAKVKTVDAHYLMDIDHWHIVNAYQAIHDWVCRQGDSYNHNEFQSKFRFNTKVIWFIITDKSNPIDTFIRINMGKIPLTNSELIRALFLQKKNFTSVIAEYLQLEIATEWDIVERTLQNDSLWFFLNKEENNTSSRIELIFNIMCDIGKEQDKNLADKIGADQYTTFRFFSEKFPCKSEKDNGDKVRILWNEVKDYFLAFEEWYNNPAWYHYIGYLVYYDTPIKDVYKLYKGVPKNDFLNKLKEKINFRLKKYLQNNGSHYSLSELSFSKDKLKIKEILLLFNIQYTIKQHKSLEKENNFEVFVRFPFDVFKKEIWDIEHIHPNTENKLTGIKEQKEWLQVIKNDIKDSSLRERINKFIDAKDALELNCPELKNEIINIISESDIDAEKKDGIGNLTLLV